MKKVKLGLYSLNTLGLISLANRIFTNMSGNLNFTTPPSLLSLQTMTQDLENSYTTASATHSKQAYALVRANVLTLRSFLITMADYINMVAEGNETIILSAGVNVTKNRTKAPIPAAVTVVTTVFTNDPNTIMVNWGRTAYARIYDLFVTANPFTGSWTLVASTSKREALAANLTAGTRYYFRVVAIGTAGTSAPSEFVSGMTMSNAIPV
jgi:hypothetical protein